MKEIAQSHGRDTEVTLLGASRVDPTLRAATSQKWRSFVAHTLFDRFGCARFEHAKHALCSPVEEAERRNRAFNAIEQLPQHRRRARRQAAIERMEMMSVFLEEMPEKGQIPPPH